MRSAMVAAAVIVLWGCAAEPGSEPLVAPEPATPPPDWVLVTNDAGDLRMALDLPPSRGEMGTWLRHRVEWPGAGLGEIGVERMPAGDAVILRRIAELLQVRRGPTP